MKLLSIKADLGKVDEVIRHFDRFEGQFSFLYDGGSKEESMRVVLMKADILHLGCYYREAIDLIDERTKDKDGCASRGTLLSLYILKISAARCLLM